MHVHFCCGKGAGDAAPKGWSAIERAAQAEGIFFDPFYTGKSFAGLLELNEQGYFKPRENIVFFTPAAQQFCFRVSVKRLRRTFDSRIKI